MDECVLKIHHVKYSFRSRFKQANGRAKHHLLCIIPVPNTLSFASLSNRCILASKILVEWYGGERMNPVRYWQSGRKEKGILLGLGGMVLIICLGVGFATVSRGNLHTAQVPSSLPHTGGNATTTSIPASAAGPTDVTPTVTPAKAAGSPKVNILTPAPTSTATPAPSSGINGNPWGYDFTPGNLIYNPPNTFCNYFTCVSGFGNGTGYVVQCVDLKYSKTGGKSGSCSQDRGAMQPLYSHEQK